MPAPTANSLLNTLNPYATGSTSLSRSELPPRQDSLSHSSDGGEPDSPSAFLLRELSGGPEASSSSSPRELDQDRSRFSPTPTPTTPRSNTRRAPHHSPSSSSTDEDAPPRSLIFGDQQRGDRTPRSPQDPFSRRAQHDGRPGISSPGPFHDQPPSSPTSTSPGPSTISIDASGLAESSRQPSTSPEIRSPPPRTATGKPTGAIDASAFGALSASRMAKQKTKRRQEAYLDPPEAAGEGSRRKGKGKEKRKDGRKYVSLPTDNAQGDAEERDVGGGAGRLAGMLRGRGPGRGKAARQGLSEYEKALWRWVNVDDLDGFLQEVYDYYKGKGIYCITLARILNLLTTFFVIAFSTFLLQCVDYSKLNSSVSSPNSIVRLEDVLVGQCLSRGSFTHWAFVFTVSAFYLFQLVSYSLSIPRLLDMYRFYTYLLGIPDADIQTLPWPEIVRLIGEIRKHNPVTSLAGGQGALADMVGGEDAMQGNAKKLDAHDVANRILRQENYLIALFNKDLLDLRVRLPLPHGLVKRVPTFLLAPPSSPSLPAAQTQGKHPRRYLAFGANTLTKALEWNLRFCLMGYLFDRRGQVRKEFVRERRRKDLVQGLKLRFAFMGVLNAIFAPFIVVYLLVFSFFRYFEEYHKNPSSIGSRQYTPYAQWKFREFNELPHLFERRLDRSYPVAKEYVDQFPKERTALVMRFVAFIAGSFAAVLLAASLFDPDLFLHFEITPHRTVLFYLGLFGGVLAVARGMVPEENMVFDPEASLREVVRWTHYLPGAWRGKLHSKMVHEQFSQLFAMKITIFFTELLSVLLTPFILLFSLPPCSGAIIDFFREFTVHVDGVGYVCSFAVFDFTRHGAVRLPNRDEQADAHVRGKEKKGREAWRDTVGDKTGEGDYKMEKSFLHFKATHPDWVPNEPSGSVFLEKLMGMRDKEEVRMSGSAYAGGRGLGLGGEGRERIASRERSMPWGTSSHLVRPTLLPHEVAGGGRMPDASRRKPSTRGLETMRESVEEDDGGEAVVDDGWNKRVNGDRSSDDDEGEAGGKSLLRDVGVMGLLRQVSGR